MPLLSLFQSISRKNLFCLPPWWRTVTVPLARPDFFGNILLSFIFLFSPLYFSLRCLFFVFFLFLFFLFFTYFDDCFFSRTFGYFLPKIIFPDPFLEIQCFYTLDVYPKGFAYNFFYCVLTKF